MDAEGKNESALCKRHKAVGIQFLRISSGIF